MATRRTDRSATLRPAPEFEKWLTTTGVQNVIERLKKRNVTVSRWTVYTWIRGARGQKGGSRPRQTLCPDLVAIAGGQLSAAAIYPPPLAKKQRKLA